MALIAGIEMSPKTKPLPVTMFKTVSLPVNLTRGKLYLCSMPGRFAALAIFLQEIAEAEIGHILCLVSDQEIAKKSPDYLAAIQQNEIPAKLWRYDVPDYGFPEESEDLKQTVDGIRERLDGGESVIIHCAAGHGRTGMISILLLTRMGLPLEVATQTIHLAGSAPDTQAQWDYLERHARP
jgi:protein-tyrosine phosphatase